MVRKPTLQTVSVDHRTGREQCLPKTSEETTAIQVPKSLRTSLKSTSQAEKQTAQGDGFPSS